jgi:TRAP-type C4-dicarboxylate transport system permease small subunit
MTSVGLFFRTAGSYMTRLVQALAILVSVVMVGSLLVGIVYRYVLQNSLAWSDEVALLCFTWMVFLTAALAVRDNSHVRVELVNNLLPERINWLLNQLIWVAIAMTGAYMVWMGTEFVSFTFGQTSAAMRYPTWLRDASLPVSGVLIVLYALANLQSHDDFQRT